ncbi:aminoglycoside phosphotransferase family protein [soil metagenome]
MGCVPFELSSVDGYPTKQAWDAAAAEIVATMLDRWHLVAHEPYVGGEAGSVLRVTTAGGAPAVLKVGYPHFEAVWEAVALDAWEPRLAPAVLRQDAWTWSMLLEQVEPGTPLSRASLPVDEALRVGAELYRDLCGVPVAPGIPSLAEIMDVYARQATARLDEQAEALAHYGVLPFVERGISELAELAESARDDVLLHGDFNPGNILEGRGDDWFAIDPKPMHGDPAFDLWPLLEQLGDPWLHHDPAAVLAAHLDSVAAIVECEPARAARWAFARSVLNVSWYLADGNREATASAVREVETWARITGT